MGRNTKLTRELQDRLLQSILADNYFETACWFCGITPKTGYNWLNKGDKTKSGIYHDFFIAFHKAEAIAEVGDIAYIKAGKENWQSRAWIRERRNMDRWGKRERVEHTGMNGGPIQYQDASDRLLKKLETIAKRNDESVAGGTDSIKPGS